MPNDFFHSDDELLRRMALDDQQAFTGLYQRHWENSFSTAVKVLRSQQEAEDVIQDVFLTLWNRRKELQITGSVSAYLQTSIRYKAIHYIEKNIARRDYLSVLTDMVINTLPASPELQLQLKHVQETIADTVSKMPNKMQEVYKLSRHDYLTHKEIADQLNISTETVKKHIQHALQLIKSALSGTALPLALLLVQLLR